MIFNYFKVLWRQLRKYRWYSLINIAGLSVGLATCLFIYLYIQDEVSYDRFYPGAEEIYRLRMDEADEGTWYPAAHTYPVLKQILDTRMPETTEHSVRVLPWAVTVSSSPERQFAEKGFYLADSTFFDLFQLDFLHGDRGTALNQPNAVVLTASAARKYFGRTDVVGEAVTVEESHLMQVTGVVEDLPSHSSLEWDFVGNIRSISQIEGEWVLSALHFPPCYTFVKLSPGTVPARFEEEVTATVTELVSGQGVNRAYHLQPLVDIHLNPGLQNEPVPTTNPLYLWIFGASGLLILILAGINFTNLATARTFNRAREVGLRKTIGASRGQLVFQYISESVAYAVFSACLAVLAVELLMPYFNNFTGKEVAPHFWTDPPVLMSLLLAVVVTGVAAGAYPSFILSSIRPAQAFDASHSFKIRNRRFSLRTALVAFQFVISAVLVIASLVVNRQLHFMMESNLGFQKEQVVVVETSVEELQQQFGQFKQSVTALAGVESASALSNFPWESGFYNFPATLSSRGRTREANIPTLLVDVDFVRTMQMEVLRGRGFSDAYGTDDARGFLVNEAAADQLGWEALGTQVSIGSVSAGQPREGEVIGVVKNFHFQSMYHEIDPLVIMVSPQSYYYDNMVVRLRPGNVSEQVAQLASVWEQFMPDRPFDYFFLDDAFDQLYRAEQRIATISNIFMGLALFIAGMGLFGIASIHIRQRTREIGIRKVYGASTGHILRLISREYVALVFVSNLLAWGAAWALMDRWLENFAYRIAIQPLYFVLTFAAILMITFLSIGFQAMRAARMNPVDSIRGQ